MEIHVFCDASEYAVAAVGFVVQPVTGSRSMVFAKCRVASLKAKSIPRLELDAAVLGLRVRSIIKRAYSELEITQFVMWTDARDVLFWLRSSARKYSIYVANRVSTILAETTIADWRWVPTT